MRTDAARAVWTAGERWLERLKLPFHLTLTVLAGAAMLVAGAGAILNLRSMKYLGALIVIGIAGAAFMALPKKFGFFLYAAGFTLPYFVQVILIQRDRTSFAITGTFLVISALGIIGLATRVLEPSRMTLEPRITIPIFAFVCACLLSMVNTTDRTLTLVSLVQEVEMLLIFLILVNVLSNEAHAVSFLRGLYLGFAIQCVIYVIQNMLGFSFDVLGNRKYAGFTDLDSGRIGSQRGTFGTAPAAAALYFSLMTLSLTGLYLSRRKLRVGLMPLLGMMMGLGCLVLSAKRAAMSGFAIALLVVIVLLWRRAPAAFRKLLPVLGSLALAFLLCLPVFLLRASEDHEAAYEERANLTRVAWNMYHAHPVAGVGFGTYDTVKRQYLPPDWSGWLYTVHTRYLLILSETGAVGFTALLAVYLAVLVVAYRGIGQITPEFRPLQICLVAGLVAVYWEQVWDIFNSRQQGYLYWFMVALAVALPRALAPAAEGEKA